MRSRNRFRERRLNRKPRSHWEIHMRILVATLFASFAAVAISRAQTPAPNPPKAVLVTGASTGIGRKITERLAADGHFVYATARKPEDLKALGALKNVQPVRLDVTQPAEIAAALETITRAGRGLYGLVNNAGVVDGFACCSARPARGASLHRRTRYLQFQHYEECTRPASYGL